MEFLQRLHLHWAGMTATLLGALWLLSACSGAQQRDDMIPVPPVDESAPTPKTELLQPGWADVWCRSSSEPGVDYSAPGYDEMSESMGKARPTIRWQLTDMGGGGTCHLLGIPERPTPGAAKYVLRSVKSFERRGGQCICRPMRTRVQEGIYRPKAQK